MANQTYRLILKTYPNQYLLFFIFFSTICSYSFHWYLTSGSVIPSPRINWLNKNRKFHLILFIVGLMGATILLFFLLNYWHWLLLAAVITFLYSAPKIPHPCFRALRKAALGKTIFLALVWMYVTTILPITVSEQPWRNDFILFIVQRFFLVYVICILFDLRDREDDKDAGIRSLITFLSPKGISIVFARSLSIFCLATIFLLEYGYSYFTIALLLIPGIITALIYTYARKNFSDILYYFVLDGLMAFSAILMLITGINKL